MILTTLSASVAFTSRIKKLLPELRGTDLTSGKFWNIGGLLFLFTFMVTVATFPDCNLLGDPLSIALTVNCKQKKKIHVIVIPHEDRLLVA